MNKKSIVIIVAHPDDEVLACGGTSSRLSKEGHTVNLLVLSTGMMSRGDFNETDLKQLQFEALEAAKFIGIKNIEFGMFPDNQMDTVPLLDVVKKVEEFVKKYQPDIIFTHHKGDINVDHSVTFKAVMTATRPLPETKEIQILASEVLSSSEFGSADQRIVPNVYFRLSREDIQNAVDALACYKTEIRLWPHPRSTKALEVNSLLRGSECGVEYAEAFEVMRFIY